MSDKTLKLDAVSPMAATTFAPAAELDYDQAVEQFYKPLYQFAFGLTGCESDAADLTQETYQVLLIKGGQIRDGQKLKSWLFTTLYRKFLGQRRHAVRFPKVDVEMVEGELPAINAQQVEDTDANVVMAALQALDEKYRAPLAMFYLEEMSYREISDVLGVPPGTVMSRLSRGKDQLRQRLAAARQYGRQVLDCGGNPESFRGTPLSIGERFTPCPSRSESGVTATAVQDDKRFQRVP